MRACISRPRLRRRILAALKFPVTILAAPAGYGKTMALNEAIRAFEGQVVHYSLGPQNDSFAGFMRGLTEALSEVALALRLSFPGAWERGIESPACELHLARWLREHLRGLDVTIVVDQLHYAREVARVSRFLKHVVEESPAVSRWIFASRGEIEFPIAPWLAERRMDIPIDANDLRFDTKETRRLCAQLGITLPQNEVDAITQRTDGWPMGVAFGLRTVTEHPMDALLCRASPESYDVLAQRIFKEVDAREQAFLLSTSLLPYLDDTICAAAGWGDASSLISAMEGDAGFIFSSSGMIRHYHDRFAEFLHQKLLSRGRVAFGAALQIAMSSLEAIGRIGDALRLLIKYPIPAEVTRLVDAYGLMMIDRGEIEALQAGLATLGIPESQLSATALTVKALGESRAGRFDTSEAWFELALERMDDPVSRAKIAYLYGCDVLQRRRGDVATILEPYASDAKLPVKLRASMLSAIASERIQLGEASKANAELRQALALAECTQDTELQTTLYVRAAYVALYSGDTPNAKSFALTGARLAQQSSQFTKACSAYSTLYALAADEDDAGACIEYLRSLAECGVKSGNSRMHLYALQCSYELEVERGDMTAMAELRSALRSYDVYYENRDTMETVLPSQALELAWKSDFAAAYSLLSPSVSSQTEADRQALRWAELALYAACAGMKAEARAALHQVRRSVSASEPSIRSFRARVLSALALYTVGRRDAADRLLRSLAATPAPSPRAGALLGAVTALCASGGARTGDVANGLEALSAHHAGGLARMFGAIPARYFFNRDSPRKLRRTLRDFHLDDAEFKAALLERATLPAEWTLEIEFAIDDLTQRINEALEEQNPSRLEPWLDTFLEKHTRVDSMRTIISFVPAAVRLLLPSRARGGVFVRQLEGLMHAAAIRKRMSGANGGIDILDEVDAVLNQFVAQLDDADPLTAEHSRAVSSWCSRLARKLGLSADEIVFASRAGLVHDVGKIGTPPAILSAARRLTAEEWEIMRRHTVDGEKLVRQHPLLFDLIPAVRSHHERLDGKGYPDGLPAREIPFIARLVSVADCFNAMIARRPYRKPMPPCVALSELRQHSGTQLDPDLVEAMCEVVLGPQWDSTDLPEMGGKRPPSVI